MSHTTEEGGFMQKDKDEGTFRKNTKELIALATAVISLVATLIKVFTS